MEEWLGHGLPADYKELVDGYGDAILFGHLFVPHPEGSDPLLKFVQEEQRDFRSVYQGVRDIPPSVDAVWERVVPWGYHDWNGDLCLLVPDPVSPVWNVAVAFRQCPGFLLIEGGVVEFLRLLLREKRFPRGWPTADPNWESLQDSPLL
ncbi:hypothetical protein [Streptomyces sp. NPDC056821]|uniref:hypothetical protein n=1 Tax=unclassified Streptomyces TaxID=2593676 RepID=UPI003676F974